MVLGKLKISTETFNLKATERELVCVCCVLFLLHKNLVSFCLMKLFVKKQIILNKKGVCVSGSVKFMIINTCGRCL